MTQILEGVRVLEVAQWWFVPSAGAALCDWGAQVIKIEDPAVGDPIRGLMTSGFFPGDTGVNFMLEQPNRGKQSVAVDLKTPGGLEILYRLAERSDVFLTSFLPALRRRLQIDVEQIRAHNPNIIYVRGSGHGVKGPDIDKPGFDGTSYWSRSGMAHALTPPGADSPTSQRASFGDGMGGLTLAGGIAGALYHRERTGKPSVVDVSLLATAMWQLAPDIDMSPAVENLQPLDRTRPANPVVNTYETRDGRWLQILLLQADRDWADFCEHIGRRDLIDDPRFSDMGARRENLVECVSILEEVFAGHTLDEWRERLATLRGAWTPLQTPREVHDDPQVLANGFLRDVVSTGGATFKLVANPVQYDEQPYEDAAPAPIHGQHTEEVLIDSGFSWDDISAFKQAKAIP